MAVVYLQAEDEITGAVARLRAMAGTDVVMVVPAGSRVATSRINFRLLGREAHQRGLHLAVVSSEPAVRSLATAAGLSAHPTVESAETALAKEAETAAAPAAQSVAGPSVPSAAAAAGTSAAASSSASSAPVAVTADDQTDIVPVVPASLPSEATGSASADGGLVRPPRAAGRLSVEPPLYDISQVAPRRPRRIRTLVAPAVAVVLLLVLVGLGLYGAYLFVPTATIKLTPKLIDVGPLSLTVTADSRVAVIDPAAGLIPATKIDIPLQASDTFSSSGSLVTMTAASGTVRFSSKNTVFSVPVPAGTVVSTANGIDFQTTSSVTVPVANFDTHKPGTVDASVVATDKGTRGNVAANTIKKLPDSLTAALVTVRNPAPTSGGTRIELAVVTQSDYDAALATLTADLQPMLTAALNDPATTPHGLTVYAATAVTSAPAADQPASAVVDTQADTFTLAVTATTTVVAVNEDLVDQVAQTQLNALVPPGTTLLPQTITITHAPGEVNGQVVIFNASGIAKSWRSPDENELLAAVSGQSVTDARTIMEKYGTVDISIWPDFIDRLPADQNRIRLTIVPPQETP